MIHKEFLKMLGEYRIVALLLQLTIIALPFFVKHKRADGMYGLRFMWLIGIVIGSFQPIFPLAGLSNCLVLWLCYGLMLGQTITGVGVESGMVPEDLAAWRG